MYFAIVEDFEADAVHLAGLIRNDCAANDEDVEFLFYGDAEAFLADFRPGLCDVVFLDIIMKNMSGVDAARRIRERDSHIPVIFTTTEGDFALDAYGVHALDYLLKPVRETALNWCMERIRGTMELPAFIEIREIGGADGSIRRQLPLDHILYAEAARNKLFLNMTDGIVKTRMTLTALQKLLPGKGRFYQCGRGLLVNFSHVERIAMDGEILLSNEQRIYCSRRLLKETREAHAAWRSSRLHREGALLK